MNRKIYGLMTGLMVATLALGLGACGGEDEQPEGQRGAQRTTTEITMQTLAGEWGFDRAQVRESIRNAVEANMQGLPGMPAGETFELSAQDLEAIDQVVDEFAGATITLHADGSLSVVGMDNLALEDTDQGSWRLNNRSVVLTFGDEEPIDGRVIDTNTIEIDFDEMGDIPAKLTLQKRS